MDSKRQRHRFPAGSAALAIEAQATGYEIARLVEFGGELAPLRAHRLSTHLVRTAVTLKQQLAAEMAEAS